MVLANPTNLPQVHAQMLSASVSKLLDRDALLQGAFWINEDEGNSDWSVDLI
jgi:hypothetical protein